METQTHLSTHKPACTHTLSRIKKHTHTHRGIHTHILSFCIGVSNLPLILALIFNVSSMRVPCHLNIAKPAAGHRRLTTQPLCGVHRRFRELYIPISCQHPGAMDSIQGESHSITAGVHCGFVCFLPVLMHKVNTTIPMCTGVRVCEGGGRRGSTLDNCACMCIYVYVHVFMSLHLMAPHHSNIIYIKNNASDVREICA